MSDEIPRPRIDKLEEAIRGAIRQLREEDPDFDRSWMVRVRSDPALRREIALIAGPEGIRIRIEPMEGWADPTRGSPGAGQGGEAS